MTNLHLCLILKILRFAFFGLYYFLVLNMNIFWLWFRSQCLKNSLVSFVTFNDSLLTISQLSIICQFLDNNVKKD